MTILMIEQGTPGFSVGKDLDKLGYKGPESSEVFLNDCVVPAANVGEQEGQGLQQALSALGSAASASPVGPWAWPRPASTALAYARERHAFGRPIAEFQAIQLSWPTPPRQAARLLTWWAARPRLG
jgi:alkylation response protein AidB-like acyl-CoA dehydrogenase